jgi:Kef-type K+ transport system membrane component KefB
VLELVLGIVLGPDVLGWVEVDDAVRLMALLGLGFILLLAGLELDPDQLRGHRLRLSLLAFALSFAIAVVLALGLRAADLIESPLLVAIIASATSLGVVIPVLVDNGEAETPFGQLVLAACAVADVATIVLLSLFFSGEGSTSFGARLLLLTGFGLFVAAVGVAIARAQRWTGLSAALVRLQDTTAQIRVRGAFLLLVALVFAADRLGIEAILGAFLAGAILRLVDRDEAMTHPDLRVKLTAVGYGVFVPFFFVASGLDFDLDSLLHDASAAALVPLFVFVLLAARGLPALVFRRQLGPRRTLAAGLLQAVSLGFIVVGTELGMELGLLERSTGAAFVTAGLVSVIVFPLAATTLLRVTRVPRSATVPAR